MKTHAWGFLSVLPLLASLAGCSATVNERAPPAAGLASPGAVHALSAELAGGTITASGPFRSGPQPRVVPGEILVKYRAGTSAATISASAHSAGVRSSHSFAHVPGLRHLVLANAAAANRALRDLRARPDVEYAEPNYVVTGKLVPNDPQFPSQWALNNTGQTGGVVDADIDAPEAWQLTTGDSGVVIAVLDSGVDYLHEDLAANIWQNPTECSGNLIDDDGNGYVDDCHGIDVVNGDSDPADDNGHGTLVSGVIAAVGNNGIGISGVAWNARILPCKFLDATGTGSVAGAVTCLDYVASMKDRGVNVVASNNSWGGAGYSAALRDAIDAQRTRGILFVVAAGNDGLALDGPVTDYPCSYDLPNIVCVASSNSIGTVAPTSNVGTRTVHLSAPGESILSTLPGNQYGLASGTSLAAPHVSGVLALLAAQDPQRGWLANRNLVLSSGRDSSIGTITHRELDAALALSCSNSIVEAPLKPAYVYNENLHTGVPVEIAMLRLDCAQPLGAATATILPSNEIIALSDDGLGADHYAGDGVYTGTWTPIASGNYTINFPAATPTSASVVVDSQLKPGFPVDTILSNGSAGGGVYTTVGDVAGDAKLEIMVSGLTQGPLYVWDSAGNEVPGWPTRDAQGFILLSGAAYPVLATTRLSATTGKQNLFTSYFSGTLAGFDSSGGYLPGWPLTLNGQTLLTRPPVTADMDGDGSDEIFINDSGAIRVLEEDGTAAPGYGWLAAASRFDLAIADLDGDGRPEIISFDAGQSSLLHVERPDGTSLPGFPVPAVGPPLVGDVDGDGHLDVIAGVGPLVIVSDKGVVRTLGASIGGANTVSTVALGDLDGDGIPEIVATTQETANGAGFVRAYAWKGDGSLVPGFPYDCPPYTNLSIMGPVIGDIDADGVPDIAFTVSDQGPTGRIFALSAHGVLLTGYPKQRHIGYGAAPAIADLDLNGYNDLVVSSSPPGSGQVFAFEQTGPVSGGPVEWGQVKGGASHTDYYETGKNLASSAYLAANVLGSGAITSNGGYIQCGADCVELLPKGTQVTLTATAGPGQQLIAWRGACAGQGNPCVVTVQRFTQVAADFGGHTLSTIVSGTGTGTVTSSPAGIDCPAACSFSFGVPTQVVLTAVAGGGSTFSGWSGACSGTAPTCTVTVDGVQSVGAAFTGLSLLNVAASGTGAGSIVSAPAGINCGVDCNEYYAPGTQVTLTATPDAAAVFGSWSGDCTGTAAQCVLTMDVPRNATARFIARPQLTVTLAGTGSGTVASDLPGIDCGSNCSALFLPGATVTLTATAASGSVFSGWSGACSGSALTCVVTLSNTSAVTATFAAQQTLAVSLAGGGTGSVSSAGGEINCGSTCNTSLAPGATLALTATAASDSVFIGWSGACTGANAACSVTMDAPKSVTATFELKLQLSVTVSGSGSVSSSPAGISCGVTCAALFAPGVSVVLTATPAAGNVFDAWSGACSGSAATCTVALDAAKSVGASFKTAPATGGGGSGGGGGGGAFDLSGLLILVVGFLLRSSITCDILDRAARRGFAAAFKVPTRFPKEPQQ